MPSFVLRGLLAASSGLGLWVALRASADRWFGVPWIIEHPWLVIASISTFPLLSCFASIVCAVYSRGVDRLFNGLLAFVGFKLVAFGIAIIFLFSR